MKMRAPWAVLALLLLTLPASAQQVKEAVDLLPARTLACLEVRQPEKLAREVNLLVQGSSLETLPLTMARYRSKYPDNDRFRFLPLTMQALFLSPELINEMGRMQGAAVALTGVTREGEPIVVGVIMSGDSNFLPFYMRAILLAEEFQIVSEEYDIPIVGMRRRNFNKVNRNPGGNPGAPANPNEPDWIESGPYIAQLPGNILVLGSTPESVKDVVKRFKGKNSEASLGSVAAYRDAAKLRDKPGLFGFVDSGALSATLDEHAKRNPAAAAEWEAFKTILNPAAFRGAVASLSLVNGTLEFTARVDLERLNFSPLVLLLPSKPTGLDALNFAPRDGLVCVTMNLEDGEKRWQKLLALADAALALGGQSDINLPSKRIQQAEEALEFRFGRDVFSRLSGMAVVVDSTETELPTFIFQARDVEAARALEDLLPRLFAVAFNCNVPMPTRSRVDGITLGSLKSDGAEPIELFYTRQTSTLVIGPHGQRVVQAAQVGFKKEGLLTDPRVAEAARTVDGALLVGVISPRHLLMEAIREDVSPVLRRVGDQIVRPGGPNGPWDGLPRRQRRTLSKQDEELLEKVAQTLEPLPPSVFTLSRKGDTLILEGRQPGLRGVTPKLITVYVEGMLDRMGRQVEEGRKGAGGPGGAGKTEEATPARDQPAPNPDPKSAPPDPK